MEALGAGFAGSLSRALLQKTAVHIVFVSTRPPSESAYSFGDQCMAVSFQIDDNRVRLTVAGPATAEDVLHQLQTAFALVEPEAPVHLVIDVTQSELLPEKGDLRRIADVIARAEGCRVAVLVAHEVRFGLARQIGAYLEGHGIAARPFWDPSLASAWLAGTD